MVFVMVVATCCLACAASSAALEDAAALRRKNMSGDVYARAVLPAATPEIPSALTLQPGPQMLDPTRVFPLPAQSGYAYEDGFGDARSFGGERSHEGVDIIVDKGTPVYSSCNGVVTKKGWLTLGGWRIGVEDAFGVYHYYAHLSAYAEGLEVGDAVSAGQLLGYVGSTGYGPEGTDDQMIPHLHFGLYINDIAIDPYPYLQAWDPLA